ncbi:MAG: 1,4-dihydroxy-6-naphthoate synthase [Bacteroidota bacterium]
MKIRLGISSCPNDTYIFDALVNGKIDLKGYSFELVIADIEELNQMATQSALDMVKVSIGALPHFINDYRIMDSGAALGNGVGPLVVAAGTHVDLDNPELKIAIPGIKTTANLLLTLFYPHLKNKKPMLFSDIESAVLSCDVDAGVLIHEGRFTYAEKGLCLVADLGSKWENHTRLPLPLGCICASRGLSETVVQDLEDLTRDSLLYANAHPESSQAFIMNNAQEMKPEVVQKHIELYVNQYSISLGPSGRSAIEQMISVLLENPQTAFGSKSIFTNFAA